MPKQEKPKTEKQIAHLKRLNELWSTQSHRFRPGGKPWNFKHRDLPHNKNRIPLVACGGGCGKMVSIYGKTKRCQKCMWKQRSDRQKNRTWKSGYVYEQGGSRPKPVHIVKAEQVLGRPLRRGEQVHHINMIKKDNRNCNLMICSASYHTWLHMRYAQVFAARLTVS